MEFKIGDKVRVINMNNAPKTYGDMINKMGVIKWNAPSEWGSKKYGIAFEDVKNRSSANGYFYFSNDNLELVYNIPTLLEIKENNLRCVIKVDSKEEAMKLFKIFNPNNYDANYSYNYLVFNYQKGDGTVCFSVVGNKINGFDTETAYKEYEEQYGKIYRFKDLVAKESGITTLKPRDESMGFESLYLDLSYFILPTNSREFEEKINKELTEHFNAFPNDGISANKGGKNPMKFTFYVTDWVDINKTNGEKIPMKRTVAYIGSNTDVEADTSCPVAEYDERIGCLIAAAKISAKRSTEAKMMYNIARSTWGTELSWAILFELANTAFNGNFERVYKKFHNDNIRFEKKRLTCSFCGKIFKTIEEKTKHENEHIQNKKNKRERYLIRKEAKRRLAEAEREGKIEQTMKELYKK